MYKINRSFKVIGKYILQFHLIVPFLSIDSFVPWNYEQKEWQKLFVIKFVIREECDFEESGMKAFYL